MLSIIGTALNAATVHIMMMGRGHAPIASYTAGREITPDTGTTVVKIVTIMTANKEELADNAPNRCYVTGHSPSPQPNYSPSPIMNTTETINAP